MYRKRICQKFSIYDLVQAVCRLNHKLYFGPSCIFVDDEDLYDGSGSGSGSGSGDDDSEYSFWG